MWSCLWGHCWIHGWIQYGLLEVIKISMHVSSFHLKSTWYSQNALFGVEFLAKHCIRCSQHSPLDARTLFIGIFFPLVFLQWLAFFQNWGLVCDPFRNIRLSEPCGWSPLCACKVDYLHVLLFGWQGPDLGGNNLYGGYPSQWFHCAHLVSFFTYYIFTTLT